MKKILTLLLACIAAITVNAQISATAHISAQNPHQRITGFGGFVCSPQFQYNHMSTADIKKVWGKESSVGCNIMRLYIPIGKNFWSQSLATAKAAKDLGLIVFASPWGQPAEWKTNNSSNAKNDNGENGYLKKENWADYAQYLEDYVQYLRTNGVELDAISIQNEPDWPCSYAGCLWSESDMASFVKTYGPTISCKVIAPETLAISDSYANALNNDDVLAGFDIYGGHQYGGIQSAYKNLGQKGKELWMTEYLINWNENQPSSRNYDYNKDCFDFFRSINTCMLGDFNAWIHYAAKRYYGMLGDGQCGTTSGTVTKRGYIMSHFARFVTGMTRIDADFGESGLEGSAYLSQTCDSVAVVIANSSSNDVNLTIDLPFYTKTVVTYQTSKTSNCEESSPTINGETCRPVVNITKQGFCTVIFIRSRDRQPSDMICTITRFGRIDDITPTQSEFGDSYKMSGGSRTFDHSNPLISDRTNADNGYIPLDDRYGQLVMRLRNVSSTMNYSSAKTTLTYVNAKGEVSTRDYGDIDLSRRSNFNLSLDLSTSKLSDGCIGIISLTNNNWSSSLTMDFGDVYVGGASSPYFAKLTGTYDADDSNLIDCLNDAACTSIDMTAVTKLPETLPWIASNHVAFLASDATTTGNNIVVGNQCKTLALVADGTDFRPTSSFSAEQATLTLTVDGCRMVMVPFAANVPANAQAYTIGNDLNIQPLLEIPAHTPFLLVAQGEVTLTGSGEVSYATSPLDETFRGCYTAASLFVGDYVLDKQKGVWGFRRLTKKDVLAPFGVYANIASTESFLPLHGDASIIGTPEPEITPVSEITPGNNTRVWSYDKKIIIESKAGNRYRIVDLNGRTLCEATLANDREEVSLSRYSGIAIVVVNGKSFKVNY